MTMLGMTTRHGLCSRQVRLIRQAGEPEHLLRDSIREFGLDLAVIFWRTLLLSPGSVAPFLLSSAQRNFGALLRANAVLCLLPSFSKFVAGHFGMFSFASLPRPEKLYENLVTLNLHGIHEEFVRLAVYSLATRTSAVSLS